MQLDALLQSIDNYISKDLCSNVSIIYNTSTPDFDKGYEILKNSYDYNFFKEAYLNSREYPICCYLSIFNIRKMISNPKARWQLTNFRELTLQCLSNSDSELTMFLTDDSIFIRPVELTDKWMSLIWNNPKATQLSLRLGKQFDIQPLEAKEEYGIFSWHYSDNPINTNWGYRFSVDAHLYQTHELKQVLDRCIFTNPSFLEGFVQDYANRNKLWNNGYSLIEPCILSYPLNMVQNIANNESQNVSPKMMNELFIKGYKIVYPVPSKTTSFQQYPKCIEFFNPETNQKQSISLLSPMHQ